MSPVDNRQVNAQATLTQLVPISELAPGEVSTIRNRFIRTICELAANELRLPITSLVVRDIRPKADLDYTYEDWGETTGTTADAYETMSTGTGSGVSDKWIGFYGVMVDKDCLGNCTMLKFNIGNGDRAIWELESLKDEDNGVGFSPAGVVIPPNTPYTISRYVRNASSPARILLKGVVVEPRGKTISP